MPIHDWTRVAAGTWHDFHLGWIARIHNVLNCGGLPEDYYAQTEQIAGPCGPDVLLLPEPDVRVDGTSRLPSYPSGGRSIRVDPPQVRFIAEAEIDYYMLKRRTLVIRHNSGDRIVALLEIVSPGNKASRHGLRSFVEKAVEALYRGYHLLVVDLFPPTSRDPQGIHGAIWSEFCDESFQLPSDEPLTLAAYSAGLRKRYYVEPTAVGRALMDLPLFLEEEIYVNVPLEATYQAAYRGVPRRWQRVLEATPTA